MSGVEHVRMSSSSSGDESPKTKVGNSSNNSSKSNKGIVVALQSTETPKLWAFGYELCMQ